MGTMIHEVGKNLALFKVKLEEIRGQDVNARVMAPEMQERLTENIRKEGRLEQLPFCVVRPDHFELVSGHHRTKAARAAGLEEIFVIADTRDLKRSAVVAKQLAHNRISGFDDKQILARLYDEMAEATDIIESFVTPDDFDDIRQLTPANISDLSLTIEWRQLNIAFLPRSMVQLEKLDEWAKKTPRETDAIGVVSTDVFDRFRKAALAIGRTDDVRALGIIMTRMLDIVEEHCRANGIDLDAKSGSEGESKKP